MKKTLTPSKFRIVLIFTLILTAALGVGVFVLGEQELSKFAAETRETAAKAQSSTNELQALSTLKNRLDDQSDAIKQAEKIASTSKLYYYQDQITSDINNLATSAGMRIDSIDFSANYTKTGKNNQADKKTSALPNGLKSITATITFANPNSYDAIYKLLSSLENNVFRMQASNISITELKTEDFTGLSLDTLTLEVYIK